MATTNGVMMQFFHWYSPADGGLWRELGERAKNLKDAGITAVWLPPAYKAAAGADDVGYAVYDLFDLGEFDQKNTVRTKYGTRQELVDNVKQAQAAGLQVYADVVLNQRLGADEQEEVSAVEVDKNDRTAQISEPYQMHAYTRFTFPGRGKRHSAFEWNATCFSGVDYNADAPQEDKLYLLNGKTFSDDVSAEFGTFDYLMGADVDVYNPAVREELFFWGRWFVDQLQVDGFRLDAVKHIPAAFYKEFFNHIRTHFGGRELLGVGEYWSANVGELQAYLASTQGVMKLFDVPLHFKFMAAGTGGEQFDLSTIFAGTLSEADSLSSVTFVENHDTQPGQSLESPVADWFKPLAYALILLRREGYPCVFYPDYYGVEGGEHPMVSHRMLLDAMLDARKRFHFGDQHDYLDHPNCIAWVRTGDAEHPGSMVVVMSNGGEGTKRVNTFAKHATFVDRTGHVADEITTGDDGLANFRCPAGKLSIWIQK